MDRGAFVLVVTLLGCGPAAPPPASPTPAVDEVAHGVAYEPSCTYAFKGGKIASPTTDVHALAAVEADRASTLLEAGDPLTAAQRYMDCAAIYRDADEADATAAYNAEVCYYDAAYAFATAGAFAREGAAALEAAAAEDPRRASYIRDELLAKPPSDCTPATR